jgi:hypothetical protein
MPGVMRRILEETERGVGELDTDPLEEVVQNADDAHAREVRIGFLGPTRRMLVLAYSGGERVWIDHVMRMSFAFLSTKGGSAETIGKFGGGLKALKKAGVAT